MAGTSPIKLGSASLSSWTFEAASSISTSPSGIQSCVVSALWPDGSTILSNLPAAGASVSAIESTGYIPSSFVLDLTEKGPDIDYIEGRIARAKFTFKRQDPNRKGSTASRQVFVDGVINYKSLLQYISFQLATGESQDGIQGFPEPICTVMYNSDTEPGIADGLYALPVSTRASGFPSVPDIGVPASYILPAGSKVSYYNNTTNVSSFTNLTVSVQTIMNFSQNFKANPNGWQLQKIKITPVANRSFFDVEETWRISYVFSGNVLLGTIPPFP